VLQPAAAGKLAEPTRSPSTVTSQCSRIYADLLDEFDPNFNIVTP